LRHGRTFGLRSCLRIRATGCYHPTSSSPSGSSIHHSQSRITIKYEAILPDVSFQVRQIHSLPLQLTPLSRSLTLGNNVATNASSTQMGYLTLSETRKILVLRETDSSTNNVMSTPVVGVWVSLPDMTLQDSSPDGESVPMVLNTVIWGCCVRYLCNQNILEKVWVDERTFLLVCDLSMRFLLILSSFSQIVFTSHDTYFFEITPSENIILTNKGLESPLKFLCYDFTTDLVSSTDPDLAQSILAKFKPTRNLDLMRICNPQSNFSSNSHSPSLQKMKSFPMKSVHEEVQ
jgi:hypothetical protein